MSHRFEPALALLAAVCLLSACTAAGPVKVDKAERERLYQAKSDRLDAISGWSLEGRLAVSDQKDGGSGQFYWQKNATGSRMDFHGALGRGAWQLESREQGATLMLADGTIRQADSIDLLVRRHVGWEIPVESMSWWVRGLVKPGRFRKRQIDADGNVGELLQDGWTVVYKKYKVFEGVSLPVRLDAQRGDWKVKLVIRGWELTDQMAVHD